MGLKELGRPDSAGVSLSSMVTLLMAVRSGSVLSLAGSIARPSNLPSR